MICEKANYIIKTTMAINGANQITQKSKREMHETLLSSVLIVLIVLIVNIVIVAKSVFLVLNVLSVLVAKTVPLANDVLIVCLKMRKWGNKMENKNSAYIKISKLVRNWKQSLTNGEHIGSKIIWGANSNGEHIAILVTKEIFEVTTKQENGGRRINTYYPSGEETETYIR